jgi:hypothetical protein
MFWAFITPDHRAQSASMNSAIPAALRGRNTEQPIQRQAQRYRNAFPSEQ